MIKAALFFIFFPIFFLSAIPVNASKNFSTEYDVTYTIQDSGLTHVNFVVDLTNTTSQYYASSYTLRVGLQDIRNLKASDSTNSITPTLVKKDDGYAIQLTFKSKVVGVGKKLRFTLSFDTQDITQKNGNIWEVNIPGITNPNDFSDINVHVKVPSFLGSPTYIKPHQDTKVLDFTKKQLGKSGISLAFGKKQNYSFSLKYHLKNSNMFPVKQEIALPPSTNYQDVFFDSITPKPRTVRQDDDGNWLAEFYLFPSQKIDVVVKGKTQISLYPKKQVESLETLKKYTEEKPYWEVNDEVIKKYAKDLKTPQQIYKFVVNHLTYDFSRVITNKPRVGAKAVLQNPTSSVCLEFTDLFIALARAANIPAREVDGFAYTQNTKQRPLSLERDILHAWPQYYDTKQQTWIMVDPTWGNTTGGVDYFSTFDFDHIAFAIKGESSGYPIPAGGYKFAGKENNKDVGITFTDNFALETPLLTMTMEVTKNFFGGFPVSGIVILENKGKAVYPAQSFLTVSNDLFPIKKQYSFPNIPPFGLIRIPVSFDRTPILTNKNATITIRIGEKTLSQRVLISPLFFDKKILIGGSIVIFITGIIFIIAKSSRRLPFFG